MLAALDRIDEIIKIVKQSKDTNAAKTILMSDTFKFSNEQVNYVNKYLNRFFFLNCEISRIFYLNYYYILFLLLRLNIF